MQVEQQEGQVQRSSSAVSTRDATTFPSTSHAAATCTTRERDFRKPTRNHDSGDLGSATTSTSRGPPPVPTAAPMSRPSAGQPTSKPRPYSTHAARAHHECAEGRGEGMARGGGQRGWPERMARCTLHFYTGDECLDTKSKDTTIPCPVVYCAQKKENFFFAP